MAEIPDSHRDLFEEPVYAVFTTLMADGEPMSTLVWCDYDGEFVRVNSQRGRVKVDNVERDPRTSILLVDTTNPWKYLNVRGRVAAVEETGAVAHIDALTQKYLGKPHYFGAVEPVDAIDRVTRVIISIRPEHVLANGG